MGTIVIVIIIVSSITNMVADVLMKSGKDHRIKNQSILDIAKKTPDKHLYLSGIIGLVSLLSWMSVLYYLSYIEGIEGILMMFTYAAFIGCIMVFHVICSYTFLLSNHSEIEKDKLAKVLYFYMAMTVIFSVAYSGGMMYLGLSGVLKMNIIHYITLPLFSTILIQFMLGKIVKIKHFDSIAGTLSMLVSLLATMNIIATNFPIG